MYIYKNRQVPRLITIWKEKVDMSITKSLNCLLDVTKIKTCTKLQYVMLSNIQLLVHFYMGVTIMDETIQTNYVNVYIRNITNFKI